jgi:hypothetical protein
MRLSIYRDGDVLLSILADGGVAAVPLFGRVGRGCGALKSDPGVDMLSTSDALHDRSRVGAKLHKVTDLPPWRWEAQGDQPVGPARGAKDQSSVNGPTVLDLTSVRQGRCRISKTVKSPVVV